MTSPSSVHAVISKASCGKLSSSMTKLWYLAAVNGLFMEVSIMSNQNITLDKNHGLNPKTKGTNVPD
jgi:hypothetical protein